MSVEEKSIEEKHWHLKIEFIQVLSSLLLFDDWNERLLTDTEAKCGFAQGYYHIIFPDGLREIIDFFEQYQDQKMLELLSNHETPVKITEKISLALRIRIKHCVPKLIYSRNNNYFTKLGNVLFASKIAFRSCDLIWRYAGDKSIDYNYYSKRSLLVNVYVRSIIFYMQDDSENNVATDQYITNSLSDIIKISFKIKNIAKLPNLANIPIIRLFS
jgi:ubiquinone biosynthesis protein COQ9